MRKHQAILNFLHQAEKLKSVLRHSWLSSGRRESVAEHTWRMALMAMVFYQHLEKKNRVNLEKVLKMALVHDLSEVFAGDVPAWKKYRTNQQGWKKERHKKELAAIKRLTHSLPSIQQKEIVSLWKEFEALQTKEAKFVRVLDMIEGNIQHNEASLKTWNQGDYRIHFTRGVAECEYDKFLKAFKELGNKEARAKIKREKRRY